MVECGSCLTPDTNERTGPVFFYIYIYLGAFESKMTYWLDHTN